MPSYIDDGYQRDDGYITAPEPGPNGELLFDALNFSYRPAMRRELVLLNAHVDKARVDSRGNPALALGPETICCEFIVKKMIAWDLKDRHNNPVSITKDTLMQLHVFLFEELWEIIQGIRTSDKKPDVTESPKTDAEMVGNSDRV